MTRSIPSIIVLSLMCFTISYGLVRFPDAGILDAAQGVGPQVAGASSESQKTEVLKPTIDGSVPQQEESSVTSALPEEQAISEDLYVTQPTTAIKEMADSASDKEASENKESSEKAAEKAPENKKKKSNKGGSKSKESKKSADIPADKTENAPEKSESKDDQLPTLESEPVSLPVENVDPVLIGIPDNDKSAQDDSMPIESDLNPLPMIDPLNSEIPSVIVDNGPSTPKPETETPEQDALSIPEMTPDDSQSTEKFWDDYFNENAPSNALPTNKDNAPAETVQPPVAPEPMVIKADPNAHDIPAKSREKKSANKDALTLPGLDDPQNVRPNADQPDTGTIPMESFPLDASATQKVNYTVECQQEPYDSYGFNIPATGPIIVRRLPSTENSIDPIYNNAQLDRFAL